ncbi:amidase family protein [Rathayibacter sp. ZW T2_19]|uniref:Amidase family protein n=1 Tax=Rathayibacter rubneri TaxID=2950106 RepID=A0A9X2IVD0_9MICO|nr:amidase family protein [Rathayibacter rubneri]MCM6764398.1 amidase family protein [Rathayibacter rubneri]
MSHSSFRRVARLSAAAALCSGLALGAAITAPAAVGATAPATAPAVVVDLSITDALALLESGATTSVALTQQYLDRIAAYDDPYGDQPGLAAVILANPDALDTAAALDAERAAGEVRGPLHGIPILVKDNYATFDMPTTAGSASLHTYQTKLDSTAVQRLRDAGAIILAKTNMAEFAWHGTYTLSSERGRTNNPYNQANSASGSSGGTGAAVAAGYAPAGLGTDTCGSIVGPSAHQSLVGYRPTMGLTSVTGIVPLSPRQDVSGPMTTTVTDAALLMEVLAGFDPTDPLTVIADEQDSSAYVEGLSDTALEGKRIGYVRWDYEEDPARPGLAETTALIDQAVLDLRAQGAEIVEVPTFTREFVSGTLVSGGYLDMRPSIDSFFATTEATWPEGLAALTEPAEALTFSDVIADGKTSLLPDDVAFFESNADLPNPAYDAAIAAQDAGKAAMDRFFLDNDLDALAMPTSATSATPEWAGTTFCDVGANTGVPTVSLPAGFTSTGAAAGLELAAPRSQDAELLAMSYDYEQATMHRVAPASTPELVATEPTPEPTATPEPTVAPTVAPTAEPTAEPTTAPTASAAPVAPVPSSTPKPGTAKPAAALAHTGAEGTTGLAALAFALVAGGGAALALTRRRRPSEQ